LLSCEQLRGLQEKEDERAAREATEAALQLSHPHYMARTTAEPRPNAYIEPVLGVPKPYGGFAPLKPTDPGSNMRHIRAPAPVEIEI
jgi:hypothetical protein